MVRGIVIGWLCASLTFGLGAFVGANWYEHRILDTGDDLLSMVNQDGWELMPRETGSRIFQLRRPRLRLH